MDRCLEDDSSTEASLSCVEGCNGSCDRAAGDTIRLK